MFQQITFRHVGDRVVVLNSGALVLDLKWDAALAFGQALVAQARRAEEEAKANQIVLDQAVLIRSGVDFPMTAHPKIQEEALKESRWNRLLRRFIAPTKPMPERIGQLKVQRGNP
jgi:hypothetical protein